MTEFSIKELLMGLIAMGKEKVVSTVVDDLIFPFYEARTGKASPKTMRKDIARKIEESLSATYWTPKVSPDELDDEDEVEELDDDLALKFVVVHVFPQAIDTGEYVLMVHIQEKGSPVNSHTMTLEDFMRSFMPHSSIKFKDLNS